MFKRILILPLLLSCIGTGVLAQNLHQSAADKIIAVVGSKYVSLYDLNSFFMQSKTQSDTVGESYKCDILYDMIAMKVLNEQAFRDSIIVPEANIERELDNRLDQFIQNFGSKELLEKRMGKSVYQIKEENREVIREQLTADEMKNSLNKYVAVTPEEVKAYYNTINSGEKPYINASVEIGQIIVNPKPSEEIESYAKNRLEEIRKEIVDNGKDFSIAAGIYSQDPGSRDEGGMLTTSKSNLDPAFASAAFRLKDGEISPVFRSGFGYHIVQMIKRTGDVAQMRHILIIPEVTSFDLETAQKSLDSVRKLLVEGKLTYNQAVDKVSNDDIAKGRGGIMFDLENGQTRMTLDRLDPQVASTIESMKVGEFSQVQVFNNPYKRGAKGVRILYLKNRIDPHVANLEDDYTMFQNMTRIQKQNDYIRKYVYDKVKTMYIKIDPHYKYCEDLAPFYSIMENNK